MAEQRTSSTTKKTQGNTIPTSSCKGEMSLDSSAEPAGDTNAMIKGDLTAINDNASTTFEQTKEAPATKRRKIMANNGIAQKIKDDVASIQHAHKKALATLLDLPTELRLQICEVAFHDIFDMMRFLPLLEGLIEHPPCIGALALSHTNRTLRMGYFKTILSLLKTYELRVEASQKLLWQVEQGFKIGTITQKRYYQVIQDNYHTIRSWKLLACCLKRWEVV